MRNFKTYIKGSLFCPFLVIALSGCQNPEWKSLQGEALGTTYSIQFLDRGTSFTEVEMDSIMDYMNHGLSTYQKNSLISAFNDNDNSVWNDRNQIKYFTSDMIHLTTMLEVSAMVTELSAGAFNPTAGLLFSYWSDVKNGKTSLDSSRVAELLQHQGFDHIKKDENKFPLKTDSALALNFNAVAKGYAVDEVADYLRSLGIERYMVEIGGEISVLGASPKGGPWRIGVNKPVIGSSTTEVFEVIELNEGSMATSGNYRNYFVVEGDTLGHTIDPRTGYPVMNALRSASVMHTHCAIADAVATACMVLGPEAGRALIESDSSLKAYFVVEKEGQLNGYFIP